MSEFIHNSLHTKINVSKIITILYMEFTNTFFYDGEKHDFWEAVYIDKGEMICTAENRKFILKGGEMTFHKPNEYHNLASNGIVAPNVSIITFVCKSKIMKEFQDKIILLSESEKNMLAQIIREGEDNYQKINIIPPILGMEKRADAPKFGEQIIKNSIEIFLLNLARRTDKIENVRRINNAPEGQTVSWNIQKTIKYIQEHLSENLTVKSIAFAMNESESTLKKQFAGYKSKGIMNFVANEKIKAAKQMIREKNYNFTEISEKLGFDNVHYFSKCFKDKTGMTATDYRKSILGM